MMIDNEISKVLSQMRVLSTELRAPAAPATQPAPGNANFGDVLKQAIATVNDQQSAASSIAAQFESGTGETSVAEVMIAMQKASLSFQAMTEVRNRLVDAYTQIMNMPI